MADTTAAAPSLLQPSTTLFSPNNNDCKTRPNNNNSKTRRSVLSPCSAVAPAPFLAVSRLHVPATLETIYEEETDDDHQAEEYCIIIH